MHFHWSSWVHQESQKSGSARGWLSTKSHLEEKQFKYIHDVHRVSHCRMTSTLKFSMNPPLPSEDARTPSEEERADSNGSPTMQWERVESSVCKLSRRDDRVRNCAKVAGERRDIDKCWIFIMNNQIQLLLSFFFFLPQVCWIVEPCSRKSLHWWVWWEGIPWEGNAETQDNRIHMNDVNNWFGLYHKN